MHVYRYSKFVIPKNFLNNRRQLVLIKKRYFNTKENASYVKAFNVPFYKPLKPLRYVILEIAFLSEKVKNELYIVLITKGDFSGKL